MDLLLTLLLIGAAIVALVSIARRFTQRVTVYEYERALRYDKGRLAGVIGPGRHWVLRNRTRLDRLDVRPTTLHVPGQEILTEDGVSLRVSIAAEYVIVDPLAATQSTDDYVGALHVALQLSLREIVGGTPIDDLLQRRGEVGAKLLELASPRATELGLELRSAELKDLMFPGELRRTFAQVVSARKEGEAALERARGETAALRNLANAARMMEQNPTLLQLRLLQELGAAGGNTIVLGIPSSATPLPIRSQGASEPPQLPETE